MARVLFTCSASPDYIRNQIILRGLGRYHQVERLVSSAASYPSRLGSVLPHVLLERGPYDVCIAGFLGQPLMPFLRLRTSSPIILDAFVSVYDTLCLDRRTFSPQSPVGRFAKWLDRRSMNWAALVLSDTSQQAEFMAQEFGVPRSRFVPIPVGVNEDLFHPRPQDAHENVRVLYYSTFLPLHGADVVIEAARILRDRVDLSFTLIGRGPERARVEGLARKYKLANCEFIDWVALDSLPSYIASANIFLGGHFNAKSDKAKRVIPGKVFHALAMMKPAVVGDCPAIGDWFEHGTNAYVVPMGDAESLARAILELGGSPGLRVRIGKAGRLVYEDHFSEAAIASRLNECVEAVLGSRQLSIASESDSSASLTGRRRGR